MTACAMCERGPKGVEGHLDLFIETMNAAEMQFRCRTCGGIWARGIKNKACLWTKRESAVPGGMVPKQIRREEPAVT